jgi:branched-chain amino acid transport system permease protein
MALAAPPARRLDFSRLLKEAAWTALVVLALAIPLVGFEAIEINATLSIRTRFGSVAAAVVIAFFARLAVGALRGARLRPAAGRSWPKLERRHLTILAVIGLGFALVLPILPFASSYVIGVAINVVIYVMLGWGLNVVVGLAGLLDLGYVAFYAVGAYSFAVLARQFHFTFWEALPIGGLLAATFGVILGFPVLRLRGDYLAIVTLGFGEIIHIVLQNWVPVTNGPAGIGDIPAPTLFGLSFARTAPAGQSTVFQFFHLEFSPLLRLIFVYYIILALALVTNAFTLRLRKLPIGRAWEALREDEVACRALGINPTTVKLSAFAIGAMLGGFAGTFFAARQNFVSPESFTFTESATILAIVVLGGAGSQLGVVLAATVLVTLPELGRQFAGVPVIGQLGELRTLLFGAAMIGIMIWRPRGLLAQREPSLRLGSDRGGAA